MGRLRQGKANVVLRLRPAMVSCCYSGWCHEEVQWGAFLVSFVSQFDCKVNFPSGNGVERDMIV